MLIPLIDFTFKYRLTISLAFENPINKMVNTADARLSQTQSLNFLLAIVTNAGKVCNDDVEDVHKKGSTKGNRNENLISRANILWRCIASRTSCTNERGTEVGQVEAQKLLYFQERSYTRRESFSVNNECRTKFQHCAKLVKIIVQIETWRREKLAFQRNSYLTTNPVTFTFFHQRHSRAEL